MFIPDLEWSANVDGKREWKLSSTGNGLNKDWTHLDDPVLGRASALPLEHGVDAVGLRHADGLGLGAGRRRRHVPLARVLVQLEVVQPLERRLRAQDHLVAVVLRAKESS